LGDTCHTRCECGKQFRVIGDAKKKTIRVLEEVAVQTLLLPVS
jgi:hypothetical protein